MRTFEKIQAGFILVAIVVSAIIVDGAAPIAAVIMGIALGSVLLTEHYEKKNKKSGASKPDRIDKV